MRLCCSLSGVVCRLQARNPEGSNALDALSPASQWTHTSEDSFGSRTVLTVRPTQRLLIPRFRTNRCNAKVGGSGPTTALSMRNKLREQKAWNSLNQLVSGARPGNAVARATERSKPLAALFSASHHCMTLLGSMAGSKPTTTGILMLSAPGQYHTPGVAWTYGWFVPGGMGGGASAR
jgi:hypothetical protein